MIDGLSVQVTLGDRDVDVPLMRRICVDLAAGLVGAELGSCPRRAVA